MIIPFWLLPAACLAIIASVAIAYRIGYLMGEERGFVQGQTKEAEDVRDMLGKIMDERGLSDVDTVRERLAP